MAVPTDREVSRPTCRRIDRQRTGGSSGRLVRDVTAILRVLIASGVAIPRPHAAPRGRCGSHVSPGVGASSGDAVLGPPLQKWAGTVISSFATITIPCSPRKVSAASADQAAAVFLHLSGATRYANA